MQKIDPKDLAYEELRRICSRQDSLIKQLRLEISSLKVELEYYEDAGKRTKQ